MKTVAELQDDLAAIDAEIGSAQDLYLSAPPSCRSPILRHALIATVAQRARLECEINNARHHERSA